MEREILHVNTDDFYASVLRLRDPALRSKAVVVAGPSPRGVVISSSYEARRDGVERGMTVSAARRICSGGAFLAPDWRLFRRASRALFAVLGRFSPVVEHASLDEGYVDYTGCGRLFGHVLDAGSRIKGEILRETGLRVSLGVASNKLVSHVASRTAKCSHVVDVYPGCERDFLAPLPIRRFPAVGVKRACVLGELGIRVVGDILLFPEELFSFCFGPWGLRLYRGAMGEDHASVRPQPDRTRRFSVEVLLQPDSVRRRLLDSFLYRLSERLGERLRSERYRAGALILELRYADGVAVSGREGLSRPSSDDSVLFEAAEKAFARLFRRRVRVRFLLLSAAAVEHEPVQLELFTHERSAHGERMLRLHGALDHLRSRLPEGVAPVFGRGLPALRAGGSFSGTGASSPLNGGSQDPAS